jgi:glycosyltransferase involved in cell wall biosynthesis
VLASNACTVDARVIRSAETAAAADYDVSVLAHKASGASADEVVAGVRYLRHGRDVAPDAAGADRVSTPLRSAKVRGLIRRTLGAAIPHARRNQTLYVGPGSALKPDIVHAHDLYTLPAGHKIARRTGAKLIYDAHELETSRNGVTSSLDKLARARMEGWLIGACDAVITVSDSIADHLVRLYGIRRPVVIHNAPRQAAAASSGGIRETIGLGPDVPLAVYIGAVTIGRGLTTLIDSMVLMPDVHVAFLGPRNNKPTLRAILAGAKAWGVMERIHFIDPVPAAEVPSFVRGADVSVALIQDVCLSYRYSFPNKLLESLFASVPVVASRLPEYERVLKETGAGRLVDQTDPVAVSIAIRDVIRNRARYTPTAAAVSKLASTYGWDVQAEKLLALYDRLAGRTADVRLFEAA